MFRAMLMAQKGPQRVRAWEARWDVEPDFRAFTQVDVLNIVRRLLGEL